MGVRSLGSDSGIGSFRLSMCMPGHPTQTPFPLMTTGATAVTRPPALQQKEKDSRESKREFVNKTESGLGRGVKEQPATLVPFLRDPLVTTRLDAELYFGKVSVAEGLRYFYFLYEISLEKRSDCPGHSSFYAVRILHSESSSGHVHSKY